MRKVIADVYSICRFEGDTKTEEESVTGELISVKGGDGPNRPWIIELKVKDHPELKGQWIFGCSMPVGEVTDFSFHPNQEYGLLRSYEDKNWLMVKCISRKRKPQ